MSLQSIFDPPEKSYGTNIQEYTLLSVSVAQKSTPFKTYRHEESGNHFGAFWSCQQLVRKPSHPEDHNSHHARNQPFELLTRSAAPSIVFVRFFLASFGLRMPPPRPSAWSSPPGPTAASSWPRKRCWQLSRTSCAAKRHLWRRMKRNGEGERKKRKGDDMEDVSEM